MKVMETLVASCMISALVPLAGAGPIDPPSGPVSGTMKPLDQIEPRTVINAVNTPGDSDGTPSTFKIVRPGSYYLVGSVTGETGKIGIEIASDNVTIDLGGFEFAGVSGSLSGVQPTTSATGITIQNGALHSWGQSGIYAYNALACRVNAVTAFGNGGSGLVMGGESVIVDCIARSNGGVGILAGSGSTVRGCVAAYNAASGIVVGAGGVVSACASRNNSHSGFESGGVAAFTDCIATYNSSGFIAGYGATYTACTSAYNTADGFWINVGSMATDCSAYENGRDGFHVWHGTVSRSRADRNGRDGIRLDTGLSTATENSCRENGLSETGAGIRAVGTGSRVDSNQVLGNDYGVVAVQDCVIVRNTARGNTTANYSFPSGSEYGQIITNPGNGFTSSNPWANFAY